MDARVLRGRGGVDAPTHAAGGRLPGRREPGDARGRRAASTRYADGDAPVLICGEHGTGRELVARVLHQRGPRGASRFVAVRPTFESSDVPKGDSRRRLRARASRAARGGGRHAARQGRQRSVGAPSQRTLQARDPRSRATPNAARRPGRRDRGSRSRARGRRRDRVARALRAVRGAPDRGAAAARSRRRSARRCSSAGSSTTPPRSAARSRRSRRRAHARLAAYPWPGNVAELKSIARRLVVRVDAQPRSRPATSTRSCRSSPSACRSRTSRSRRW